MSTKNDLEKRIPEYFINTDAAGSVVVYIDEEDDFETEVSNLNKKVSDIGFFAEGETDPGDCRAHRKAIFTSGMISG